MARIKEITHLGWILTEEIFEIRSCIEILANDIKSDTFYAIYTYTAKIQHLPIPNYYLPVVYKWLTPTNQNAASH